MVRVDAPGRSAMHVVALIGNNVTEVGDAASRKVGRQLRQRKHFPEFGRRLKVRKVYDAVVLRDILRVRIGDAITLIWIAVATITRIGHVLEIASPAQTRLFELGHQVGSVDGLPWEPVRVVAADAEEVAAEHAAVISLPRTATPPPLP